MLGCHTYCILWLYMFTSRLCYNNTTGRLRETCSFSSSDLIRSAQEIGKTYISHTSSTDWTQINQKGLNSTDVRSLAVQARVPPVTANFSLSSHVHNWMMCVAHVNVQPRTKYDSQETRSIYHTQACSCTEQSINMITDDVTCVSMVAVIVMWGLFTLIRFDLEMNVPPALSTGLSWLWGCREKRGRDGNISQLEDFSVDQLDSSFIGI